MMEEFSLDHLGVQTRGPGERDGDEAIFRDIERRLGAELPGDYRSVVARYGGLAFEGPVEYFDPGRGCHVELGWLFDARELADAIEDYAEALPDGVIAIGDDGGGNLYCLGIAGTDRGRVFFHDHGIGWSDEAAEILGRGGPLPPPFRYETVDPLASSFAEFLGSFRAPT